MTERDRFRLLEGPYRPPKLRRGQRGFCLARDRDVVVTGWSDGRIPWPRCKPIGVRGGTSLLIDEEMARAIMTESAQAVCHWWGVAGTAVWKWRRALGVDRVNNRGTRRLMLDATKKSADMTRGVPLAPEVVERRRAQAIKLNLGRFLKPGQYWPLWKKWEIALLRKMPDEEVARRTGRTPGAVRVARTNRGIPKFRDRRFKRT